MSKAKPGLTQASGSPTKTALSLFRAAAILSALALCSCYDQSQRPLQNDPHIPKTFALEMNRKALESLKANQLTEALEQVEQALAEDPQFYSAYSNKALILGKMGRYADAAQTLDQALEVKPDFSLAHLFRGIYLERTGDTAAANASYLKAVEAYDLELTREGATPEKAVHRAIAMYLLRGKTLGLREIFTILERYPSYVAAARLRDRMLADDRDFFMWWLTDAVAESE